MTHRTSPDEEPEAHIEAGIRALADNLGEGLVVIQKGRIVYLNDRLVDIVGASRESLQDKHLTALFPEDFEHSRYFEVRDRREEGENIEYPSELQFRTSAGILLEMRNRSSQIQWDGNPATVHFLEDITRRKDAERQLFLEQEVNSILASTVRRILASPLSLEETTGTVLDSAMGLTGSSSGVLLVEYGSEQRVLQHRCIGECLDSTLPDLYRIIMTDKSLMRLSRPGRIEGAFYLNEGIPRGKHCEEGQAIRNLLCVPVNSKDILSGKIILANTGESFGPWDLDNMEKIAEVLSLALVRLRTVENLQKAKVNAEREAETRSLFLANVSHEIRSPLNGVLMMASFLSETELNEDQKDLLGVLSFSCGTIDRLIRDLTDLTQIRSGKFTVYNEDFDLGELCRRILETNRPEAVRKGLALDYSVAAEVSRFYGDRERLGQIMGNLIVNAIKYTEKGFVRLDVTAREARLFIEVCDSGIGIPEDQYDSVFRIFSRGNAEGSLKGPGMGIGLSVVRELTDAMDGEVTLNSTTGRGSCFTVILPLNTPDRERCSGNSGTSQANLPETARILVAEDEGVNRLYLRTLLTREGFEVDEATNGLEALVLARKKSYDLALMDINMPKMDGLEASAGIREIHPDLPIIAITARTYDEDRFRILEAGLNDIVRKPINEGELKRCLRRYLRVK